MGNLFGTDGIRGVANTYPMTPENILKIGRAAAFKLKNSKKRCTFIIGKDTRLSGYMIETALSAGICSMGADVLLVGPMPTPGVSYLTRSMRADAGVVISASHNEYQDNGIKFFNSFGMKLSDQIEDEIEKTVFENNIEEHRPTAKEIGKAYRIEDAGGRYIVYAKSTFPKDLDLEGLKIVVDCANGAAYKVAPSVFAELNADVVPFMDKPDGKNINKNCGALNIDGMKDAVKREGADLGIALDGDGDRVIMCDSLGNTVDGDRIMGIAAKALKKAQALKNETVVGTIMSNFGLERYLQGEGIKLLRAKVGDRYVVEEMVKGGYNLGGEQSGHVIFMDHNTTGDGIVSALQILAIMKRESRSLHDLTREFIDVPQKLINVKVREKKDFSKMPAVDAAIKEAAIKLKGKGMIVVRYSGTELKARVMVQGEDGDLVNRYCDLVSGEIKNQIGTED